MEITEYGLYLFPLMVLVLRSISGCFCLIFLSVQWFELPKVFLIPRISSTPVRTNTLDRDHKKEQSWKELKICSYDWVHGKAEFYCVPCKTGRESCKFCSQICHHPSVPINKSVMYSWVSSSVKQCSVCYCYQEFKGIFKKWAKQKCQTRREHPAQHASNTLAPKGCGLLCAEVSYCACTSLVRTVSFSSHKIFPAVGLP